MSPGSPTTRGPAAAPGAPASRRAPPGIARRFAEIGLEPAGDGGDFRQAFEVPMGLKLHEAALVVDQTRHAVEPAPFSTSSAVTAPLVYAGYGISAPDLGHDDYRGVNAKGKVVLVRRYTPRAAASRGWRRGRMSDPRWKAWNAREHGARAVIIADLDEKEDEKEPRPPVVDLSGDAGLPVVYAPRELARALLSGKARVRVEAKLEAQRQTSWNVVGRLRGRGGAPGVVVIGAHYDHLGMGGPSSLAPGVTAPHNGADDNASGVAALLEAARLLAARRGELPRDVVFVAFSAEELGVIGSTSFVKSPPAGLAVKDVVAMVNMDMVGRLRENKLQVLGGETAAEWGDLVAAACGKAGIVCQIADGGYGPSDQTPFYAAGVPVVHLFTGAHRDYHRPTDDTALINAAGGAQVAVAATEMAVALSGRDARLTYKAAPAPAPRGDLRGGGASLGTVPDYVGPADGTPGVLLAGVRAGSPAEVAGLRRGDILVGIDGRDVRDIEDFMYALSASKPGQRGKVAVLRDGKRVELEVTFGAPMRR
jgi:hypothetical protein